MKLKLDENLGEPVVHHVLVVALQSDLGGLARGVDHLGGGRAADMRHVGFGEFEFAVIRLAGAEVEVSCYKTQCFGAAVPNYLGGWGYDDNS